MIKLQFKDKTEGLVLVGGWSEGIPGCRCNTRTRRDGGWIQLTRRKFRLYLNIGARNNGDGFGCEKVELEGLIIGCGGQMYLSLDFMSVRCQHPFLQF